MPLSCAACCREARLEELEIDIQSCAGPALLHAIILSPSLAPLPLSVCVMVLVGRSEFKFAEICQRGPGRYDTRRTIGGQADNDPLLTDEPSWLPLVREILGNDCVPLWQGVVSPPMLPPLGTDSAPGGGEWSPRGHHGHRGRRGRCWPSQVAKPRRITQVGRCSASCCCRFESLPDPPPLPPAVVPEYTAVHEHFD